jgi:hypothetical protein
MKSRLVLALSCSCFLAFAQQSGDEQPSSPRETTKTGWNAGGVPVVAYDTDIGFKYGVVLNLYDYWNGSIYPKYRHNINLEWSRTTKGSGINQFLYDSEYLIPGIRVTAEASLLSEQALDFYGFNGANSYFNPAFSDDMSSEYISRVYYRHERKLARFKLDLQGSVIGRELRWLAGWEHFGHKIGTVDIEKLNKGQEEADKLPDVPLLFHKYVNWGIIPADQAEGGVNNLFKAGLVYDTRDNEPNPMKGIWTEAMILTGPSFLGNKDYSFTKLVITHRQYFTLAPEVLNLAYRISYQDKIGGEMPFYMLPYIYNTNITRDGLGGAKTIRGVLRNRIVGEDYLYGNMEVRWKFFRRVFFNQNIYLALTAFTDAGMVTGKYKLNLDGVPANELPYLNYQEEKLHLGYGAGFYVAMNQNFVVAFNYGLAVDPNDGKSGFYIGMNFLY